MAVKDYAKCGHNVLGLSMLPLQRTNVPTTRFVCAGLAMFWFGFAVLAFLLPPAVLVKGGIQAM